MVDGKKLEISGSKTEHDECEFGERDQEVEREK